MIILHQDIDKVLDLPLPFVMKSYKNALNTAKFILSSMSSETKKFQSIQKKEKDQSVTRILKKMEPPEEWFKRK